MRWGVRFAESGKSVEDRRNLVFSSETNQLKVDVKANPPHLGFGSLPTMANLTTTNASPIAREVLLEIEHFLPFNPSVSCYMHVANTPIDDAYLIGRYVVDFLRLGGSLVYIEANERFVRVYHDKYHAFTTGAPATQTEVEMELFDIRIKWLISNARYVGQVGLATP